MLVARQPPSTGPASQSIAKDTSDPNDASVNSLGASALARSSKPQPFQEDEKTKKQFEQQLAKYTSEVNQLTKYTISGLSVKSEFSIAVRITMEPSGLPLFGKAEEQEREIPIIIRSVNDGNHI